MKLLFAQGNPGDQYQTTRHNIGWRVLDALAKQQGAAFTSKAKFFAELAELSIHGEKVLLVKPTTYYNETGRSARALVDFYKLSPASDILVLHDELALPFGTLRLREKGTDAGNNGIKSLTSTLGADYWRLRIGIANDLLPRIDAHDFVLARFSKAEEELLPEITSLAHAEIDAFIADAHQPTSRSLAPNEE